MGKIIVDKKKVVIKKEGTRIYPTLVDLEVTPTVEEQIFNHEGEYGYDIVTVKGINLQDKSVTPTTEEQTIKAEEEYSGLNEVQVKPIPSDYIIPSEEKQITENGTYDIKNYASVNVNVANSGSGGSSIYAPRYISFANYTGFELDNEVRSLDTSNITSMASMFLNCNGLIRLNLYNFNTSKVTDMSSMFMSNSLIKTIIVSSFNTSNVKNFSNMFSGCDDIESIDLSSFTCTTNPFYSVNTENMFQNCKSLTKLDMRNFTFTRVKTYGGMFDNVPTDCEIIVKDDTAKTWITSKFTTLTNVKTVAEL